MKNFISISALTVAMFCTANVNAQDQIVTITGKTIEAHVKKISSDEIVYRKFIRKLDIKSDKVLYIVDENGGVKTINDITMAKHYKNYTPSVSSATTAGTKTDSLALSAAAAFKPHGIERIGDKYRVDGKTLIGFKQLNDLLAQSPNPTVALNMKAAKMMHTFTMISKISSYPGSTGGAYASYQTFSKLFTMMKAGPVPFKTYLGAGLSFMGTISLPITTGILNHLQYKLYDKALMAYSMGM